MRPLHPGYPVTFESLTLAEATATADGVNQLAVLAGGYRLSGVAVVDFSGRT